METIVVKVPENEPLAQAQEVPPIQAVTENIPKPSPPLAKQASPLVTQAKPSPPLVAAPKPKPSSYKHRPPKVVHASTPPLHRPGPAVPPPQANSVQAFLGENPEFAKQMSETIPISPKIAAMEDVGNNGGGDYPFYSPMADDEEDETKEENEKDAENGEEEEEDDDEWDEAMKHETEVFGSAEEKKKNSAPDNNDEDDELFGGEEEEEAVEIPMETKKKKRKDEPKQSEEDEMMEKMHIVERIKENAAAGLVPPQPPSLDMPKKMLLQIEKFQEEKAGEIMMTGMMGTGLIALVRTLETLNGKYDPLSKVFGHGLKLQGAGNKVEENIDAYRVPFARMYRDMRKSGRKLDVPPWAQVIFITGGLLKDVHMTNMYKEMQESAEKERRDPEALRIAEEILRRQRAESGRVGQQQVSMMPSPLSDAEMEAAMAKEFAGFDKLPSLDSIASRRKDSKIDDVVVDTPPENRGNNDDDKKKEEETKKKAEIRMIHKEEENDGDENEEDDEENEEEEEEEEEEDDEDEEPLIHIPRIQTK